MRRRALIINGYSYGEAILDTGLELTGDIDLFKKQPESFDLVMFTGGEDVSPSFYGQTSPRQICGYSIVRDEKESQIYQVALKHGIKMTGICRGIQFLNVMNGGTMMHHVNGHAGSVHSMTVANGEELYVNSLHHQMCIPHESGIVVGWATDRLSNVYLGDKDEAVEYEDREVEALIYPETNCAGVQYHPEMLRDNSPGYIWYSNFIIDFMKMGMESFVRKYTEKKNGVLIYGQSKVQ